MSGAIVFDLDGTLVDSAPDIAAAANRMLVDHHHPPLSLPLLTSFVGHGIAHVVHRIIDHCEFDPSRHVEMSACMLAHYTACPAALTRPWPGVAPALSALAEAGYRMGVCTNKHHALSVQVLEALDLAKYFDIVIGGDSLPCRKPDPAPLLATFSGLEGAGLVYVGDSEVDAATARAAGMDFALYTKGYRKAPLAALPHRFAFDDFATLPGIVKGLGQPGPPAS